MTVLRAKLDYSSFLYDGTKLRISTQRFVNGFMARVRYKPELLPTTSSALVQYRSTVEETSLMLMVARTAMLFTD